MRLAHRTCCGALVGACTIAVTLGVGMPSSMAEEQASNTQQPQSAQTSSEVRSQAAAQNARLEELVAQLDQGRAEVDELSNQIDDLAKECVSVQGELIEDRGHLRHMVQTSYKWGGMPSLWDIALSSKSIDDFVSRLYYANKVTEWQTGCVERLDTDKRNLEERMDQINVVRNERRDALRELEGTCDELSQSVNELLKLAEGLEAKERAAEEARLAAIAKKAAAEQSLVKQQHSQEQALSEVRNLADQAAKNPEALELSAAEDDEKAAQAKAAAQVEKPADVNDVEMPRQTENATTEVSDSSASKTPAESEKDTEEHQQASETIEQEPKEPEPKEPEPKEPEPKETEPKDSEPAEAAPMEPSPAEQAPAEEETPDAAPAQDDGGDWIECVASAYTIADNTPPGSTATASGIPLDESVPTVAMPVSVNPSRFYGSSIQIEYEGMTVIAMVTDCGGLGGGSRGLDITPAVFRAFGVESGDEWGLRTVRYRFI